MRKLKALGAALIMALLVASPAAADTVTAEVGGVSAEANSVFLGNDTATAEAGGVTATAESEFLFFDDNGFLFFDDDFFD